MKSESGHVPGLKPQAFLPGAPATTQKGSRDDQGEDTEDFAYSPVPPRNVVTVSVSYRIRGRGQPLPYPLAEEESE